MAKVVYVDSINGNNGNDGLTPGTAKQTIVGSRAATAAQDLVLIAPGLYLEPNLTWNSGADDLTVYLADPTKPGRVIVDFQNIDLSSHWGFNPGNPIFVGIHFRNPGISNGSHFFLNRTTTVPRFYHCVFYNQFGTQNAQVLQGSGTASGRMIAWNCTFYNLDKGPNNVAQGPTRNSYMVNVTDPIEGSASGPNNNAYPGNTGETQGIDTNVTDPGLRDPANLDFRLDPTTTPADYAAFLVGGEQGNRIGAFGKGGFYYNPAIPALRYLSADPTPGAGNPMLSWENEGPNGTATYLDGTPGDIIEDLSTFQLRIDLGTTPTATGGRIRSGVFDLGAAGSPQFLGAALSAFEDIGVGAALDTNTALPQKFEYRSSNTVFLIGDVSPTWNLLENTDALSISNRYIQLRVTFRTDHTNA
jgi:hypothetical protein